VPLGVSHRVAELLPPVDELLVLRWVDVILHDDVGALEVRPAVALARVPLHVATQKTAR